MKSGKKVIFGDFQTPLSLAREVASFIRRSEAGFGTIVEPTCGVGAFLKASAEAFPDAEGIFGLEINPDHAKCAKDSLDTLELANAHVVCEDFYQKDWRRYLSSLPTPALLIGNPPWVTNSAIGVKGGGNLPKKSNFQQHSGLEAKTGKANFDISEWMILRLIEALRGIRAVVAMLCKTATARKVLRHAWLEGLDIGLSSIHLIDATAHFNVSVDACLLVTHTGAGSGETEATVYADLSYDRPLKTLGLVRGELVSDLAVYRILADIDGMEYRKWRSAVKHDAAKVMEFRREGSIYINGLGEECDLESDCLYPLLKSSDLANGRLHPSRYVLLTQRKITDDTEELGRSAPKTWRYLERHAEHLDGRGSSIYTKRSRFSVFGVGDYTFARWKVAISGFYKTLRFQVLGSFEGKPIVVDDTCYFIPCDSESEANFFARLLNSATAQRFLSALAFIDAKRPVTVDVLRRIDLKLLAEHEGQEEKAVRYLSTVAQGRANQQVLAFDQR